MSISIGANLGGRTAWPVASFPCAPTNAISASATDIVSTGLEDSLPSRHPTSVVIDEDMTVQATSFEVAKDITPCHRKFRAELLEEWRIRD